jgi:putative choline sulfate-utilization transcription factor
VTLLRSRLPSPSSLLAFEAAARRLSFTLAAKDLNVTQGAVSRQIAGLEAALGCGLFERRYRSLVLTASGRRLQGAVTLAFDHLLQVVEELRVAPSRPALTLAATSALAALWLMPRLPRFAEAHPEIELRLVAADHDPQFARDGIDLAILYGAGRWSGMRAEPLLDEVVFPVCSPVYLARGHRPRRVADLLKEELLHWQGRRRRWIGWPEWFRALGQPHAALPSAGAFSSYTLLLQAAIGGQGIALGWRHLCDEPLRRGDLVRPLDAVMRSDRGYWLVRPQEQRPSEALDALAAWIAAEARQSDAGFPERL